MTKIADTADITVSIESEEKNFPVSDFLGYLSSARLSGDYPDSIYIPMAVKCQPALTHST